jgi:hypothetical protein
MVAARSVSLSPLLSPQGAGAGEEGVSSETPRIQHTQKRKLSFIRSFREARLMTCARARTRSCC